ncbi:MAG: quinoprotein dehydrogenase-associated SoxYZ-like carrier [Methyloversatilis sp.]|jgi:sulfur-oxidizing protein SoxY|nr:quinoprotein dehydrogenase-associated SoxYZ-like carrier [Methyloversatilis sp.]
MDTPRSLARWLLAVSLSIGTLPAASAEADAIWPRLRAAHFGDRSFASDPAVLRLEAPDRAEDAALVPVAIQVGPAGTQLRRLWLVVDENPSPMSARFTLHDAIVGSIETRVRIERYTTVRAIGETGDGTLYMAEHYVRAAGGCSAPMGPADEDAAGIGRMSMRRFDPADGAGRRSEVELRIRHPNHSGLEVDLDTRGYIAPEYVKQVVLTQDGRPLLDAELDISISRNPFLRFGVATDAQRLEVKVEDSRERRFEARFPPEPRP